MVVGAEFLQLGGPPPRGGITDWLVDAVRAAVADGRLTSGSRLPASRTLAAELGVSRGVVVEAYARLAEEGLTRARTRGGTVVVAPAGHEAEARAGGTVLDRLPQAAGRGHDIEIDLSPNLPDIGSFPRAMWARHQRAILDRAGPDELGYGDPQGLRRLRVALAEWLGRVRGVRATADDIVIVSGVAQSLTLLAQVLGRHGITRIAAEDPGSRGARDHLGYWGMQVRPVRVDGDGLSVDALRHTDAQAVLVTPAHQFPTGVVLGADRRRDLIDWASGSGLIIEDDYDADQRYDRQPVAALQPLAPGLVAHTGSTSKSLAPGMRLGWLVPPSHLRDEIVEAKHASDLGSPALAQLVLARMLTSGDYERHLRRMRRRQRERRDALVRQLRRELPGAKVHGVAAGLHVLVELPDGIDCDDVVLADRLGERGVLVHPLGWHRHAPGPPGLLIGYAANSPARLRRAAAVIADEVGGHTDTLRTGRPATRRSIR